MDGLFNVLDICQSMLKLNDLSSHLARIFFFFCKKRKKNHIKKRVKTKNVQAFTIH